jgi:hypothetical protein
MSEGKRQLLKRATRSGRFYALRAALRTSGVVKPVPAILILGHMRCGSSLLLHLLLTHPGIIGCGERNSAYRSARDLDRLEIEARLRHSALFRHFRYSVDQVNHDKFTPNEELLHSPRVRLIFLVREPVASISSIVQLTKKHYGEWSATKAVDYYIHRLNTLARLANATVPAGEALSLTYEELIADTPGAFERLQSFLNLPPGFSEQYRVQDFTGTRGDPSHKIRSGRIVRNHPAPQTEMPANEKDRALAAYRAYQQSLTNLTVAR